MFPPGDGDNEVDHFSLGQLILRSNSSGVPDFGIEAAQSRRVKQYNRMIRRRSRIGMLSAGALCTGKGVQDLG